jgi:hypothetical protein
MSNRVLAVYLKDHFAGATAGVALAQRVAKSNADRSSGQALARIAAEIEADRETLKRLMAELGVRSSLLKNAGASAMERLARLKPNGRASGAGSEFHCMHELESLGLGIAGKQALWDALRSAPNVASRVDLDRLEARARSQREVVEMERLALAREALA